MIQVKPTDEEKAEARRLASGMGSIRNSITGGGGNTAGFLSEIIVADMLGATRKPCKDYDLVMPDGSTVDVKAKRTSAVPKPYYDCSIAKTSTHQVCDRYYFTRYNPLIGVLYLLGDITQEDFFAKARFLEEGTQDGDNGFVVKADCYNVAISELTNELPVLRDRR